MCSSTVSDPANMWIHGAQRASMRKKNPLPFSFRSGRRSLIFARLGIKETGFIRVETLVSTLVPTAVGTANHRPSLAIRYSCSTGYHCKNLSQNWLSTLSTGLSTGYLGITLCIKWITFCIHLAGRHISRFSTTHCNIGCGKPPLHNPPHLVENL
mgnify:CR=1 FL=1